MKNDKVVFTNDLLEPRRDRFLRSLEMCLWIVASLAWLWEAILFLLTFEYDIAYAYNKFYSDFIWSLLTFLFPMFFLLVFGKLPIEVIRKYGYSQFFLLFEQLRRGPRKITYSGADVTASFPIHQSSIDSNMASDAVNGCDQTSQEQQITSAQLLNMLSGTSSELAKMILSRSGAYLLLGIFIAASGITFFAAQSMVLNNASMSSVISAMAPRFGIMVFIELIAFFFLKQYRVSMEEFRYYESIKRHREELIVLFKVGEENKSQIDPMELVKIGQFFSHAGRLQKEETTELLEARKLERDETAILEKIVEVISRSGK